MKSGLPNNKWPCRAISAIILLNFLILCLHQSKSDALFLRKFKRHQHQLKRQVQSKQKFQQQQQQEPQPLESQQLDNLQESSSNEQQQQLPPHDDPTGGNLFGKTTKEILRIRGFDAIEYDVQINDECTLNLVHVINPLFKDRYGDDAVKNQQGPTLLKSSVLFLHGATLASNYFLVNSINARPADFSKFGSRNLTELNEILENEPSSKCLPLLMSNFGYDIWFLNRRSTLESQAASNQPHLREVYRNFNRSEIERSKIFGEMKAHLMKYLIKPTRSFLSMVLSFAAKSRIKSLLGASSSTELYLNELAYNLETILMPNIRQKTVDAGYWHFSLDEQAVFDLPQVIDFILAKTGRNQLDIVGHSLGGALPLMTMTLKPEYQAKIRHCFLFAPAVRPQLGFFEGPSRKLARKLEGYFQSIKGPLPPGILTPFLQTLMANVCITNRIQRFICTKYIDAYSGLGAEQLDLNSGIIYGLMTTAGVHELVQLSQAIDKSQMHLYDFRNSEQNMLIYNQTSPPRYEIDKISNARLSIYVGNTDIMVPPATIQSLIRNLNVPVELHYLNQSGGLFNHISYQFHKQVHKIVNIPIIHKLELMEKERISPNWQKQQQQQQVIQEPQQASNSTSFITTTIMNT